ncbi:Mth938-like domain-containing protein [Desulfurococcaceae archaeon MEX13E-LK6-19]|nr:Mth938-like domain-containing protein [Desulfurococcaceae archaeon MEX13E-LK6-19]
MEQPLIEHYDFGVIIIDGKKYSRDVIVTPRKIVSDWWRIEGHRLQYPDVEEYFDEDVDAVVIGTGYYGYMKVDNNVVEEFKKRGREVHVCDSKSAVELYNKLVSKGKKVLLFIHLTC